MKRLRLKWRAVHQSEDVEQQQQQQQQQQKQNDDEAFGSLTVWRKSLIMSGNGFTVIDSDGNLVFRVDNYMGHRMDELILMDASGKSLLTLRRKKFSFVEKWLVFEGEVDDCCSRSTKKPIYSIQKHINIVHTNENVLAHVFCGSTNKRFTHVIEGSYMQRSCIVFDESRSVVAEIKRKETMIRGISFGVDIFLLIVRPGFDAGLSMAIVLVLDQMFA